MSHLPRLHPDDIKEIAVNVAGELKPLHSELLSKELIVAEMTCFSVDEVAKILKHDTTTILRFLNKDILKGFKSGREWRVSQQSLNDYINGSK